MPRDGLELQFQRRLDLDRMVRFTGMEQPYLGHCMALVVCRSHRGHNRLAQVPVIRMSFSFPHRIVRQDENRAIAEDDGRQTLLEGRGILEPAVGIVEKLDATDSQDRCGVALFLFSRRSEIRWTDTVSP